MRVLLLLLTAICASPQVTSPRTAQTTGSLDAEKKNGSARRGTPDSAVTPDVQHPPEAQNQANAPKKAVDGTDQDRRIADYTAELALYTKALVAVGVIQALIFIGHFVIFKKTLSAAQTAATEQARLTRRSNAITRRAVREAQRYNAANEVLTAESNATARTTADAAKTSADAVMDGQRGWILVDEVKAPHISLPAPHCVEPLDFEVVLMVSGNSPCKIVDAGLRFHLERRKENVSPPEPDLSDSPDYTGNWKGTNIQTRDIPQAGVVFAPGKKFDLRVALENSFTSVEYEAVNEGRKFLCAYGFVLYIDTFNRCHETRFCFVRGAEKIPPNFSGRTAVYLYLSEFDAGGPHEYNRTT